MTETQPVASSEGTSAVKHHPAAGGKGAPGTWVSSSADTAQAPFSPNASPLLCQPDVTPREVTRERRRAVLGACTVTCINGAAVKPFGRGKAQHGEFSPRPVLRWPQSAK